MQNTLFIPHVPNIKVINRVYEFAKSSNSYFLMWEINNDSFKQKVFSQIFSFFQKIELKDDILKIPLLFKPESFAVVVNTLVLNYAIKKFNIDVVVNANALLFDIEKISVPVFYDLVDDHLSLNSDIGLTLPRIEKIKRDIQNTQGVICVTEALEKKVKELNPNTITIENGLYIKRFKKAKSLKKELGLEGKKVFGYIGGVASWTGIDKACEAFVKIKDSSTAMIVVGDSDSAFFTELKERFKDEIVFLGQVEPKKIADYFKTIDIGLIPFKQNDFTNNAYPIKALEYGLAGAKVISTPLKVLKEKKLPFIEFCEIDEFSKTMKEIEKEKFEFDFDSLSWENKVEELIKFIKKKI